MYKIAKLIIFFSILLPLVDPRISAQEQSAKWMSITGKWETRKDNKTNFLLESKGKTYPFGYSELINNNSLISQEPISEPTSLRFSFSQMNPVSVTEQLLFFNAENYRTFYAIKLTGDGKKIIKVSLISSKISDTTLSPSVKNNFTILELAGKECSLDYNVDYNGEIFIKKKKSIIFRIDGKELLSAKLSEEITGGKIGFSNRNAMLKIADLKVYNGKNIVFEDDFSTDSIKRLRYTARKISESENEKKK